MMVMSMMITQNDNNENMEGDTIPPPIMNVAVMIVSTAIPIITLLTIFRLSTEPRCGNWKAGLLSVLSVSLPWSTSTTFDAIDIITAVFIV